MTELIVSAPLHYGVATYPPGATFGPRTLENREYEFVWMIEGDAEYTWGGQVVPAPAGSLVLCRPNERDFFRWDRASRTRHGYFHFQIESLPENWLPPSDWPLVRTLSAEDIARPLFRYLLTWGEQLDGGLRRSIVSQILHVFLSGKIGIGRVSEGPWPESVERALAFIYRTLEDDPASPLRLADLAQAANVSAEHLCRLFKGTIGYSPAQAVRIVRADYAAVLLTRTNFTITEISELCGFATPYHFSRVFKSIYKKPPSRVRAEGTPPHGFLLRAVPHLPQDFH